MCEQVIQCPECKYENVPLTVKDGEEVWYFCENCGWEKTPRFPFPVEVWNVEIRQALAPLDILQALLSDREIVDFLRPRLKGVSYLSQPIPNFDLGDGYYWGEIQNANSLYLSQMLVLALTYAELMVKDFYLCLFYEQPLRMNPILASERNQKAIVYLNEIIQAASKDELIDRLVERSASRAAARPIDEVIAKIIKECKLELTHPIVSDLKTLKEQRNRIVHEGENTEITHSQVLGAYGQLMYLLYILVEAALRYKIPFFDRTGFFYEFQEKLDSQKENPESTTTCG